MGENAREGKVAKATGEDGAFCLELRLLPVREGESKLGKVGDVGDRVTFCVGVGERAICGGPKSMAVIGEKGLKSDPFTE